jgi:hypothetical protein
VTDQTNAPATDGQPPAQPKGGIPLGRTLMWLGVAGASATLTYFVLRAVLRNGPAAPDETADRIQALIDEANRLIKTLDEKKQS